MRHKRNWLAVVGVLTASFAGGGLSHWLLSGGRSAYAQQAAGVKTVRANRFILEDENGNERASLGVDKDGPALILHDEKGNTRARLAVFKDALGLSLLDENGKARAALGMTEEGREPGLWLYDEKGQPRAALTALKDEPGLWLYDEKGQTRAKLDVSDTEGGLRAFAIGAGTAVALGGLVIGVAVGVKRSGNRRKPNAPG